MSKKSPKLADHLAVTIQSTQLREAVTRAARTAAGRTTIPILACVVIRADDSGLTLRTTDMEMSVVVKAFVSTVSGHGAVCVNARDLADTVKDLPDCELELTVAANHSLTIQAIGRKLKLRIPGMDAAEFPAEVDVPGESTEVSLPALRRLMDASKYAMCADDTRPNLTALKLTSGKDELVAAGTDGHRVAVADMQWSGSMDVLLPARAANELYALTETKADHLMVRVSPKHMLVEVDRVALTLKLADEVFPPYSKVIPKSWTHEVTVSRADLMAALRRMTKVAKSAKGSPGVRLGFSADELTIVAENPDKGEGEESLAATAPSITEKVWIGISPVYLREACAAVLEDDVRLLIGADLDPVRVQGVGASDSVHVVMPMRI